MLTAFIQGFASELVKQASHPLFQTVAKGETMLGQKVRSAISRTTEQSKKIGNKAARGAGLKKVVEKNAAAKVAFFEPEEDEEDEGGMDADQAGEMLRRMMEQYQPPPGYQEEPEAGADAPLYGSGGGKGRKPSKPLPR